MDEDKLIEFLGEGGKVFPRPYPARQGAPDWLKDIPPEVTAAPDGRTVGTVKKCPPFVDALGAGYFIPLVADVTFRMEADGLQFSSELPIIGTQTPEQVRGTPLEGMAIVKFLNPWLVRTPPGYSCMFVQPVNRFDIPFQILCGIVETDTHYLEVNFPAVCLLRPGQSASLKKGTPIMQAIPFKRDTWKSAFGLTDPQKRYATEQEFGQDRARYRNHYWMRKDYR